MTLEGTTAPASLEAKIKIEARRLGFILAGVTTPDPPPHAAVFESWVDLGRHGSMAYLAAERARTRRKDPRQIMPECKSIIVLGMAYARPESAYSPDVMEREQASTGRIAAYARGRDYHNVIPALQKSLVEFIANEVAHPVAALCYTDTGPILERDLAQRAGLGWIGKNTCLIDPRRGSYVLLGEILLDLHLEPDAPFTTDHCGECSRCIDACPTQCILDNRTMDATRCISYLTIESRDAVPLELRPMVGDWVFGCDVCQLVCPWNRFAPKDGDPSLVDETIPGALHLAAQLRLTAEEFGTAFGKSPLSRARFSGHLRNVAVASGNVGGADTINGLECLAQSADPMIAEHADWALKQIAERSKTDA